VARQKEFDRDAALERALAVFWARGYEATSIQDLVDATGVQRQSLYDTFGDKHGLYMAALRRYSEDVAGQLAALARPAARPLRLLRDFFLASVDDCTGPGRGCMLMQATAERVPADAAVDAVARAGLADLEAAFVALLGHARAAGAVPAKLDARATARSLVALLWGLRTVGRANRDRAWLQGVVDHGLAALVPKR
jgi:TetR/AcrR family transcriptional repressor of nem operon